MKAVIIIACTEHCWANYTNKKLKILHNRVDKPIVNAITKWMSASKRTTIRVTNSQLKIPWKTTLNSLTAYWKLIFIPWQLYFSLEYSLTSPYFSLFSLNKIGNSLIVKAKPWQLVSRTTIDELGELSVTLSHNVRHCQTHSQHQSIETDWIKCENRLNSIRLRYIGSQTLGLYKLLSESAHLYNLYNSCNHWPALTLAEWANNQWSIRDREAFRTK